MNDFFNLKCGNMTLICRHDNLGWSLGVTILYYTAMVYEGFMIQWRESLDFLHSFPEEINILSFSFVKLPSQAKPGN